MSGHPKTKRSKSGGVDRRQTTIILSKAAHIALQEHAVRIHRATGKKPYKSDLIERAILHYLAGDPIATDFDPGATDRPPRPLGASAEGAGRILVSCWFSKAISTRLEQAGLEARKAAGKRVRISRIVERAILNYVSGETAE